MYLTIQGLVLRITDYKDRDALLTLLTADYGRLTVKARGLRRKNSPFAASCQLLAYGEFTLFEYRGMYTINEAHTIELFSELRADLQRLSLGTYFAQIAEVISQEDMPTSTLLSLILNCLFALSKLQIPEEQIKAAYELRCACIAGYEPDLYACHVCGALNPDRLDVSAGRIECSLCRGHRSEGLRLPLSGSTLEAMRYIVSCDAKRLLGFTAAEETLVQLSQVTETYLATQLERGFSALDFYKSLVF